MSLKAREHLKLDLAVEGLRSCGSIAVKAWGTSMIPSVWPGDLLTIRNVACEEVVPGDIVLVLRNDRFFIHRLIERRLSLNGQSWITKGDAMRHDDPPGMELLGRITGIRRGDRAFEPRRRISQTQSAMAWMLCRSDRVRNLALRIHAVRVQAGPARVVHSVRSVFGKIHSALGICLPPTIQG